MSKSSGEEAVSDSHVGVRLRSFRKAARLSINELGTKAGVSNGMISQIERGLTNPSLKTLERLHIALSVPLTALLESGGAKAVAANRELIRRIEDRPIFKVGREGMTKELLTPSGDHEIQMMIIGLPAGAKSVDVLLGEGEKAGWILEGSIQLTVNGHHSMLNAGDSFQFSSAVPHSILNPGDSEARLLWVMRVEPAEVHL
ncbi:helix-turn-helix domain-containing protein [Sphingomonas crocodyli]|uniref:Helix-turn-helix domain-containing protein n=2 Tax=Sphingomonas crocodyli TaxID=1979270 RepID=A0A437MBK3_9SPHN|nr:helix-turn-helix domain-containing protein [Sphingomonas crocodyli]